MASFLLFNHVITLGDFRLKISFLKKNVVNINISTNLFQPEQDYSDMSDLKFKMEVLI